MKYLVVVEDGPTSVGAYVPDLPGCIAVGTTRTEVMDLIRDAIELHVESLGEQGMAVPAPQSSAELIEISA